MFGRKFVDVQIVSKDPEAQSVQNQMNTGNACFGNKKAFFFILPTFLFARLVGPIHAIGLTIHLEYQILIIYKQLQSSDFDNVVQFRFS